jgi:hypothetical protein
MIATRHAAAFLLAVALTATCTTALRAEDQPLRQIIDREIRAGWEQEKLTAPGLASDGVFLRRVYLDLLGTVPTYDETKQFLDDKAEDKRPKLIDKLLEDPRYALHQARVWDLTFFGRHPPDSELLGRREGFQKWLTEQFTQNVPYDRWVRDLLNAEGWTDQGPAMFYALYRNNPEEAAVAVSRLFLGTQLQCARCHDHPFEKWKQEDFYGLAGFFVRITPVEGNRNGKRHYMIAEKTTGEVLFTGPVKDQKPGQKGKPVAARFLGGDALEEPEVPKDFKEPDLKTAKGATPPKPLFSRKEKLAEWITAPDNPYFARAAANRVWAQFMGRGLVHPVDDLGGKKKPSHPALLEALAVQLKAQKFDLKWYIRELVNSQAYQAAAAGASTDAAPFMYERARVRPLSVEELMSAMRTVTGYDATEKKPDQGKMPGSEYMVMYFGEPMDGRGDFQPSLSEHLYMNNSSQLRQVIQRKKGNLADVLLSSSAPWDERVEQLYLSVLNRPPKPPEKERFVTYLTSKPDAAPLLEDAIWVLLNCAEFRFNH